MTIEWLAGNRIRGTTAERPALGLPSGSVGGWVEVGRTTLGSAGDTISVTSLPDKRYYMILGDKQTSGTTDFNIRYNNDSANNYASRYNDNGGSDGTQTSTSKTIHTGSGSFNEFVVGNITSLSGKEKLSITQGMGGSTGASNAPSRREAVGKWSNTSDAINRIDVVNLAGGDYASGAECVVLGWDPDSDSHTTNFWEELASVEISGDPANWDSGTFAAKKYLWIQVYHKPSGTGSGTEWRWLFNADSGTNYAQRQSYSGGADSTNTSLGYFSAHYNNTTPQFENMFIVNNSSNEKLIISHLVRGETAGSATAPSRFEKVGKWANTSSQITKLTSVRPTGAGTIGDGSWMKVWGSN